MDDRNLVTQSGSNESRASAKSSVLPANWNCPTCNLELPQTTLTCPQDGTEYDVQKQLAGMFNSNFEFISTIGSGGMSVIYKARHLSLNKVVAIKMLHAHLLSEQSIMRFQQEAKAASSLKHPNVIAVHDFGISKHGQPFMVMDFIDGKTLAALITERGALPLPEAVEIMLPVAEALEHAHQHNLLHRDLKPSNIMLKKTADTYEVFLVDFGIAKVLDTDGGGIAQQLTQTGELLGSPLYMSPEQCMGKKADQRTDIYSFGCILYEAVVGLPPHRGDNLIDTIFKHLNEPAVPLDEIRPDITFPKSFSILVMKCLATNPEDRYQSISEVKQELVNLQAGGLSASEAESPADWRTRLRFSRKAIAATAVAILAVALFASLLFGSRQSETVRRLEAEKQHASEELAGLRQEVQELKRHKPINSESATVADPTFENLMAVKATELDLSGSAVTDGALTALKHHPFLHSLNLTNTTNITDRALDILVGLPMLTKLSLEKTHLSPHAMTKLRGIKTLKELSLEDTNADDDTVRAISNLPDLMVLKLANTKISDAGLHALLDAKNLRGLTLGGTEVTSSGLHDLALLKLQSLDLWDTDITSGGIAKLASCKTLAELFVRRVNLSQSDIHALAGLTNLRVLQLYECHLVDQDIKQFTGLSNLKELYLQNNPLTDRCVNSICQLKHIQKLSLSGTKITSRALTSIAVSLPELTHLWLAQTEVDDEGMTALSKAHHLQKLVVTFTGVGDEGLKALSVLTRLQHVDVQFCPKVSLFGIRRFTTGRPFHTDVLYN